MKRLICPSMMCANYDHLLEEVRRLDFAGADIFHIDIMDGKFVPNFGMGVQDVQCIRRNTSKLMDVHLMVERPLDSVDLFVSLGADIIYIHPEADLQPARTLESIKEAGCSPGIAINPGTSVSHIEELLPLSKYVLVMTVNPGFAGQEFLSYVVGKIHTLVKHRQSLGFKILVDGAVSIERAGMLAKLGADGFILGTSALFGKEVNYSCSIKALSNI